MSDTMQTIRRDRAGGVLILTLEGQRILDRQALNVVRDELATILAEEQPTEVLVDFDGVQYCTSEFIGLLIRTNRELRQKQGRVELCGLQPTIREVFRTLKLDGTMFHIHATRSEALDAMQPKG